MRGGKRIGVICVLLAMLVIGTTVWSAADTITEAKRKMLHRNVGDRVYPSSRAVAVDEPEIKAFTEHYLNIYKERGNAFIQISFENKDFLPKRLWDKIKIVLEDGNSDEIDFYTLIISCEDNVFFDVVSYDYALDSERGIEKMKCNKGDAFVIFSPQKEENNTTTLIVRASKKPDLCATSTIMRYIPRDYSGMLVDANFKEQEMHDIYMWKKAKQPSLLSRNFDDTQNVYDGAVDLDGDGKQERIYFRGNEIFYDESTSEFSMKTGRLTINEREFSLEEIAKLNMEKSEFEFKGIEDMQIIDLDPKDKQKQIVFTILKEMEGYESVILLFHYKDGNLSLIGRLKGVFEEQISQHIKEPNVLEIDKIGTGGLCYNLYAVSYRLQDGKLLKENISNQIPKTWSTRITAYVLSDVNLYSSPDASKPIGTVKSGSPFLLLEVDRTDCIKIRDSVTGNEGYLKFEQKKSGVTHFYQQEDISIERLQGLPAWVG